MTHWFASNLVPSELETATLLASELVTNAIRHGEGKIKLQANLDDDRLLVEVIDEGGGLERTLRARNFENVQGFGACGSSILNQAAGALTRARRTFGLSSNGAGRDSDRRRTRPRRSEPTGRRG